MKIVEYDDVDPQQVLYLNRLALDFALTPEYARHILRTDSRPFPYLAIYAVEEETVLGQVGIFRLPMMTSRGREDVGGVWAVSTLPHHSGRGIASRLLDEAHNRMRADGLRFSTLGTNRYRIAYQLYQKHGYEDMHVLATAFASWEVAHQPTRLRAQPLGREGYDFIDMLFEKVRCDYLGFSWRHTPFIPMRDKVNLEDVWILWKNEQAVGYALARPGQGILTISNILLRKDFDTAEAAAAVAGEIKTAYVEVHASRPVEMASLRKAGYQLAHPNWSAFMLKPLVPEVTAADARQLFGIGTDRFLISWLDIT